MMSESGPEQDGGASDVAGEASVETDRHAAGRESTPRIIPLRAGSNSGARAFNELPAPDGIEALYYEGMAAYQHRRWQEALDRFTRLKELQPARPGLDALLEEVRWFLQLQAAAPANGAFVVEAGPKGGGRRWASSHACVRAST